MKELDHDFWRLQLLDELRGKLVALEYEPMLDPSGSRRTELERLIARLELAEAEDRRATRVGKRRASRIAAAAPAKQTPVTTARTASGIS